MKKTLILFVFISLFVMSLTVASTESNTRNTQKKSKKEPLNISVFTMQKRLQPPANNKTYKWIKEEFGVTFTWDILEGNKDYKIGLLISSGKLPDLVEVNYDNYVMESNSDKFQKAGCLKDLKPLIEQYAPNLKKHYASVWNKMIDADSEKDADGKIIKEHIYSLPKSGVYDGVPSDTYYNQDGWWIQKTVLKEFGYPEIKTVDQYFDLLEAYCKKHPTIDGQPTIPFSIITDTWEAFDLWNPPNGLAGYRYEGNGYVSLENGKYVYTDSFTDENAKRWFKLANGYFQRGLIDPASFTDNRNQYYTKIEQGRVLGMFIQGWQFMGEPEQILRDTGKPERTYAPLPLTFDESIKPHYRDRPFPSIQQGYGITINCPKNKTIKILQFMDQMLEEENQRILYWGFEGEDWQKDADGRPYRTEEQRMQQKNPAWQNKNRALLWMEEAPKLEGLLPSGYTRNMDDLPWEYEARGEYLSGSQSQLDYELWTAYGVSSYTELMDKEPEANPGWYPMWQSNPSEQSIGLEKEAAVAMQKFEPIQKKYLPMLIVCNPADFDNIWDEYLELMKPLTETFNKYMQQKIDERVEKFGGFQD